MLIVLGIIQNGEWHHTSIYGNRTTVYSWEECCAIDENGKRVDEAGENIYTGRKKEIDRLARVFYESTEFEKVLDVATRVVGMFGLELSNYVKRKVVHRYACNLHVRSDAAERVKAGGFSKEEGEAIIDEATRKVEEIEKSLRESLGIYSPW
jgi:hypothetical protein